MRKPGELVTREELIARLWPDTVVDFDASLNTAVRKLRAALGDDAEAPKYLETVPRQGYRFVGPLDAPAAAPSIEARSPLPPPAHRAARLAGAPASRLIALRRSSASVGSRPRSPSSSLAPDRRRRLAPTPDPGRRSIGWRCCRSRT